MIAIIVAALWGVIMMFSSIFFKKKSSAGIIAIIGIAALIITNFLEYYGTWYWNVDIKGMLKFTPFSQVFNSIAFVSTLLYFILNKIEFEEVGNDVYEYYA